VREFQPGESYDVLTTAASEDNKEEEGDEEQDDAPPVVVMQVAPLPDDYGKEVAIARALEEAKWTWSSASRRWWWTTLPR
jgi:hypothetical protein